MNFIGKKLEVLEKHFKKHIHQYFVKGGNFGPNIFSIREIQTGTVFRKRIEQMIIVYPNYFCKTDWNEIEDEKEFKKLIKFFFEHFNLNVDNFKLKEKLKTAQKLDMLFFGRKCKLFVRYDLETQTYKYFTRTVKFKTT